MILKIIKVTGESLSPFFHSGDFVVLGTTPFFKNNISQGDMVVFDHHRYGRLIKRVASLNPVNGTFRVEGTQPNSVSSVELGPVSRDDILGKVVFSIRK